MIILGIDPGSRKAGYALIKVEGRKMSYLASGVMRYDTDQFFINRLGEIYSSCRDLILQYRPDEISIESLIYVKGTTSMIKLAQARGAMIAAFLESGCKGKVFEYAPNLVKSMVTGYGHCEKVGIQKTLNLLFGDRHYATNDESDALAIALCHALQGGSSSSSLRASAKRRNLKDIAATRGLV